MKTFKADGTNYCGKCYLDLLKETDYPHLVFQFTKLEEHSHLVKCEYCQKLISSQESLNSMRHIINFLEETKQ